MGIESDQVVYEYLSRVGDIAHQRQLSSAERMRLVSGLRNDIDRQRAKATVDSPAAVRRILDRLGTPDEVVEAAGGTTASAAPRPHSPAGTVPVQRDAQPPVPAAEDLRRVVPRPRPAEPDGVAAPPDWWRVDSSPFGDGDGVPGFVGGVEIPELLSRPRLRKAEPPEEPAEPEAAPVVEEAAPSGRRRIRVVPRPATGWSNPLLLLAAGALVVGAVLGNWFALVLGWAIAYGSRRLTPAETKLAVMWVPGLSVAAGLVWLWGRSAGRWGAPIAQGQMSGAVAETWPWVVRGAALASAVFVVWRSQRTR
ncbi:MAG: hypothetical protein JF597_27000 [Streptomyces sp.]|uniref:hypothetical protein n=1 Tax=Streptomyces sp. TaxID=1931 RepID=UPI0025D8DDC8|nr:hypothetical protein [Streptomyces sp.]MBW8797117.1 hypothetical protein [Streptomyces sp.]